MPDLADGESIEVKGSAAKPYEIKNVGGVYSCSCPAWRNQSLNTSSSAEDILNRPLLYWWLPRVLRGVPIVFHPRTTFSRN